MKIEGKEEELRKHFRRLERRQRKPLKFSQETKSWITTIGIVAGLLLIMFFVYMLYMDYSDYMSPDECKIKINEAVLESHANGFWQEMLAKYSYLIPVLVIAIAIGWIFHGVGFKII